MDGVHAMRAHREGKLTLRTHQLDVPPLPRVTAALVRDTRERLNMSQRVFAAKFHRHGFRLTESPDTPGWAFSLHSTSRSDLS